MDLVTPRIEQELAHLLALVGQPSMPAWLAYAEWKARALEIWPLMGYELKARLAAG